MEKTVDLFSVITVNLVNRFNEVSSRKSISAFVKRLNLVHSILSASRNATNNILNTTCECGDMDELTSLIERFEKISETVSHHAERMTKITQATEIPNISHPGIKEACDFTITLALVGSEFNETGVKRILKKAKRNAKPRLKAAHEGSNS